MADQPTTGVVNGITKTAGKLVDAISSPVLVTMLLVFGGLVAGIIFIWDRQSSQNRDAFINLVSACVPNYPEKE